MTMPKMLKIREVMDITGLSRVHITNLIKTNKLRYVYTGKKYLINADSLKEYLEIGDNNTNVR